jgi:hypothetical protein
MKRTAALISAITLLLLAAPALSLGPFRPNPVEFQLTPGADSVERKTQDEMLSKPLRAPKRFNLVGLTWEGDTEPAIHVRVRQNGEAWGPWTDVPAHPDGGPDQDSSEKTVEGVSSPVWAGEADYVQYRLSKPIPNLRLKFVNASGTATAADRAKTGVIGAVAGAGQAVTGLLTAEAGDPQPTINPRSSWGASDCPPRQAASYGSVKASFVHHTVNANDYTSSQVPAMILSICRYHRNTNGWDDIGYNFLVDKYGRLWEGRAGGIDKAVIGAHTLGYNSGSTGVANLGTNTSVKATSASLDAMAKLIRWKLPLHGQPTEGTATLTSAGGSGNRYPSGTQVKFNRVSGHRDGVSTTCPGDALYAQLPDLRRLVEKIAYGSGGSTYTVNPDGTQRKLVSSDGADGDPALSPPGTKIAFERTRSADRDIWSMNADGSGQRQLTFNSTLDGDPAWSPDGGKVAFMRDLAGNWDIHTMNADGSGLTRVTERSYADYEPAWSGSGKIAFVRNVDGNHDIYTVNPDGSGLKRVTSNSAKDTSPSWSPGSSKIAFVRSGDIYTVNPDSSGLKRLTTSGGLDPSWASNGTQIAFSKGAAGDREVYLMNMDGTGVKKITSETADARDPDW